MDPGVVGAPVGCTHTVGRANIMMKSKGNLGGGENEEESFGGSRSDMAPETVVDGVHNEVKGALQLTRWRGREAGGRA